MVAERIEKLFAGKERYSGDLQVFYENFSYYNNTQIPQICIISPSYNLQNEIANFFDKSSDKYIFTFVNTEEDKTLEELKKKIIFSDCIIVYTTALKLAPNDLYELCKYASDFGKKFYCLIGGWNQIQRSERKVIEKTDKLQELMPFADIVLTKAVNKKIDCTNIYDFSEGVNSILDFISVKYEQLRHEQEEEIFSFARKMVASELRGIDRSLSKEMIIMAEVMTYVHSKMNGCQLTLRNSTVDFTDLANQLHIFFKERIPVSFISYFDIEDFTPESYSTCEKNIKEKIKESVESFYNDSDSIHEVDIKNKIENIKNESQNDMTYALNELSKIKSFDESAFKQLKKCINDISIFDDFCDVMSKQFSKELENLKNLSMDKVYSVDVDYSAGARKEQILGLIQKYRDFTLSETTLKKVENSNQDEDESSDQNQNEDTELTQEASLIPSDNNINFDTTNNTAKAQAFCDAIIDSIKYALTASTDRLIHEANNRIKDLSKAYADKYYVRILNEMEKLNEALINLQKDARVNV